MGSGLIGYHIALFLSTIPVISSYLFSVIYGFSVYMSSLFVQVGPSLATGSIVFMLLDVSLFVLGYSMRGRRRRRRDRYCVLPFYFKLLDNFHHHWRRLVRLRHGRPACRYRRTGSRNKNRIVRRFRRYRLPFHLVSRCRRRVGNAPPALSSCLASSFSSGRLSARDRQHRRWRRRRTKRIRHKINRRRCDHSAFLTPQQRGIDAWNAATIASEAVLSPSVSPFQPFQDHGVVPEEVLDRFCSSRGDTFLALPRLMKKLNCQDHAVGARSVVKRLNLFQTLNLDGSTENKKRHTAINCPLVWDTGASFGLTPFRGDFIDYTECRIPVNDIARTNMVIGIGTTLHKFRMKGEEIFLPCLSYHLPSADIRLFSPQTYHTLYGGHSTVFGDRIEKFIDNLNITIEIDENDANVPIVKDCHVTAKEIADIGPHVRSALPHYERMADFLGGWSSHYDQWSMATVESDIDSEFDHYSGALRYGVPNVATDDNVHLSSAQKELLLWHWKLGISMKRIQEMMRPIEMREPSGETRIMDRVIAPKIKAAAKCPIPMCQSCQLARAKQRKPTVAKSKVIKANEGALTRDKYEVGDFVSLDQYVVKTPGRLPGGFGREADHNCFHGGTIFRDAASKYIHVQNQVSLGAGETVNAKLGFEEWLWEETRRKVSHYHSDNGVFQAKEFVEACKEDKQSQSFCGVGAKHQNAEAERAIQTVMYMARSFMIHAALNWGEDGSDEISLWSFAVDHAAWLYNRIPQRGSGLTPMELITNTKANHADLLRTHVWGCPVYVLEARLQDNQKIPKWNRRARMGQFLGYSRQHSSTVALVRNLHTGYVSPQYHVVFDDKFETVFHDGKSPEQIDTICNNLFESQRECYVEEEYDDDGLLIYKPPPLDEVWLSESERRERLIELEEQRGRVLKRSRQIEEREIKRRLERSPDDAPDLIESDVSDAESLGDNSLTGPVQESGGEMDVDMEPGYPDHDFWADHPAQQEPPDEFLSDEVSSPHRPTAVPEEAHGSPDSPEEAPPVENDVEQLGRSADGKSRRIRQNRARYDAAVTLGEKQIPPEIVRDYHLSCRRKSRKRSAYRARMARRRKEADLLLCQTELEVPTVEALMASPLSKFIHLAANDCGYSGSRYDLICNWIHPLFLKAKSAASKEDNPNWSQAMRGPFREEYWQAAVKELETLESMDVWEVVDQTDDMNVIDSIWAFKIKRFPDGMVKKFKARFCARGDQQLEGVDFFETYAPVVQWTTIRLMLILEILLQLKSKQGDVTAAFVHASLEEDERVHVRMPLGFRQQGKVLKLKKTLYGLRQSPRSFWKYLTKAMVDCGMEVSKMDPCLFIGERVVAVAFVDDILFWSTDEEYINQLGEQLRKQGLLLEQEDDAAGFLGVQMHKLEDGSMELKQTGLIDRVLEALGLDSKMSTGKFTPAEAKPLVRDEDGEPPSGTFSYSSVVGMLLYLAGHTRPDIAYAVNCCARYMFNPRLSHEKALKRIGRYLKATRDRGMVLTPSGDLKIDAFPDADFAGLYGHEKTNDPACAKSRTGFVITVSDCPMVWMSKLQSETALSTMEAEIIALAHCCRELFPVIDVVEEMGIAVGLPTEDLTTMKVSMHEDNAGALILAETIPPEFTPRSKYYAIKTVWFREELQKRAIKLLKIETVEQLGDIFTKGLPRATFEYLRKKMIGW